MKFLHFIYLINIVAAITACSKNLSNEEIAYKNIPVINCIFRQDSSWKVNIKMSGSASNSIGNEVSNAVVRIISANQLVEQLVYTTDGNYLSANQTKPEVGAEYRLEVIIPGFPLITAEDAIPRHFQTEQIKVDTSAFRFSYNPFYESAKVFTVDAKFVDSDPAQKYYLLRPLFYEKDDFKSYKVTNLTFDSLREHHELRKEDSVLLLTILNIPFYSKTAFVKKLDELFIPRAFPYSTPKFSEAGIDSIYLPQLFHFHQAYINDLKFSQIENFSLMVFGEKPANSSMNYSLRLYYNYFPGGGYSLVNGDTVFVDANFYLESNTISYSGYKYFTTYAQNVVNRGNPFTEQINVYSNIKNGAGIFAGQNSSIIKIW